jgi:hypothetical protein
MPAAGVTAVIPVESAEHASRELLRLGADVEVLGPAGRRALMERTAAELAGIYRQS